MGATPITLPRPRFHAWLRLEPLLAVILWGGVYPGARLGLAEIPILSFTALRLLVAVSVLAAVAGLGHAWRLPRALWPTLLRAGLAQATFQLTLIAGLRWTTAGHSAIIQATAPLLMASWLALTGQATLRPRQWLGLLSGLLGVGLVVQSGGGGLAWAYLGGDLLSLASAGAWVWYSLAIGPLVGALGPSRATGATMGLAACVMLPAAWGELTTYDWPGVSWMAWAGLLYGATLGMVLAMVLWGKAVHRFGAQHTMPYIYVEPVSALVLAALLLGETLTLLQAQGMLLTCAGVALASAPVQEADVRPTSPGSS